MPTDQEVAEWLLDEISTREVVFREEAVKEIARHFGEEFLYVNGNGNVSISRAVLNEFGKLKEENIDWNRGERSWRLKER